MFKKYTALLFICISGIIYAGHSFIHHHHKYSEQDIHVSFAGQYDHEEHHNGENHRNEHHDDEHHQNNSNEHSGLYDILAHFLHGEPFFRLDDNEIKIDFSKGESVPVLTAVILKWAEPISVPSRQICYLYKTPYYHSRACIPSGLRAPPVAA